MTEKALGTVAVFSDGMMHIPHLAHLLGAAKVVHRPDRPDGIDAVVGWGLKESSEPAQAFARRYHLPFWCAEDGFLRSAGLGVDGEPPLSVVVDDEGIYYDATRPSRLETLLRTEDFDDEILAEARALRSRIVDAGLSKYNTVPPAEISGELPDALSGETGDASSPVGVRRRRVLVVDQTAGDLSVLRGLANSVSFAEMLGAAKAENPGADVLVKVHPDVLAGKKSGYLSAVRSEGRVRVIAESVNPISLVRAVDRVYVVTSQLGFEAVVAGTPVTCFGAPFYSGWGLTDDRVTVGRRGRKRTVDELIAASLLAYPNYIDPTTGEPSSAATVAEHLALQLRMFAANRGRFYCYGFQLWKQAYVRAYLRSPGNEVLFPLPWVPPRGLDSTCRILVWGQKDTASVRSLARRHGIEIWRMEDGFLRSVGLGKNFEMPASLVVDRRGLYYDPRQPSDLELLLQNHEFSAAERARARRLREAIVSARLSKYNVGVDAGLDLPEDRQIILVPGQVEDDFSVRLGCRDVRTNLALLQRARDAHPNAYILYKPHPDVLARDQPGAVAEGEALRYCNRIETRASLPQCVDAADVVHTLTSLVGFEALLRHKEVHVYGQPFYAGWGLTADAHPLERRTRRLTLDELVAGALILYPRYLDTETLRFTTPEAVLETLARQKARAAGRDNLYVSRLRRYYRIARQSWQGLRTLSGKDDSGAA